MSIYQRANREKFSTTHVNKLEYDPILRYNTVLLMSDHMVVGSLYFYTRILMIHTAIDCGIQGIPSALPYLSHRSVDQ
jgi:hypothetical protein